MTESNTGGPETVAPAPRARISFERLRERTDELEIIISGLLAFSLLALPPRVFDAWVANAVHVEGLFQWALWFGFLVSLGLSYALAFAFIVHLAIRGYWVALVGLKSTFPDGVRWERVAMMGSATRAYHRERIGDLGDAIDRADRLASILFAMAMLIAMTLVWTGVLAVAMILAGGALGAVFPDPDRATKAILVGAYVVFMLGNGAMMLADRLVTRSEAAGRPAPGLHRLVRRLLRIYGVLLPMRLIAPVQFTLQSNLNGRGFLVVYFAVIVGALAIGGVQIVNSSQFAMLNRYDVMNTAAVEHGMTSAHYESLRSEHDRLLRFPMIPSDRIAETHLRLFVPHQPQRDNALARERCNGLEGGRNIAEGAEAGTRAVECIASLWTATLDGAPIALEAFMPAERRDLGMRGLVGYLPLDGLAPGRHDLALVWNPGGEAGGPARRREYRIPFWYTPQVTQRAARE